MLALQGGAGLVDQEPLAVIHYKVKAQLVQQFSETLSTSMVRAAAGEGMRDVRKVSESEMGLELKELSWNSVRGQGKI
ncbi:Alanine--glyoxylate aminotransferase 2, mitochondrial [Frankliniella fusca]|uniref:Alanine--glyoxylate aminotransferase 2, mitochondrial n=1 Tax=Frankliniella fusca TaxID=407009 RepID=A0AAE1GTE4_9NEOP|nr:Alanine--glyoxylate aminotransferase 2, mitochondrial [Frankliniella fusca]